MAMVKETREVKSVQPHQLRSQMLPKLSLLTWKKWKKRKEQQPTTFKEINNRANLPQSAEKLNEQMIMLNSTSHLWCFKKRLTKDVAVESRVSTRETLIYFSTKKTERILRIRMLWICRILAKILTLTHITILLLNNPSTVFLPLSNINQEQFLNNRTKQYHICVLTSNSSRLCTTNRFLTPSPTTPATW